jgi:hypothetical protein
MVKSTRPWTMSKFTPRPNDPRSPDGVSLRAQQDLAFSTDLPKSAQEGAPAEGGRCELLGKLWGTAGQGGEQR